MPAWDSCMLPGPLVPGLRSISLWAPACTSLSVPVPLPCLRTDRPQVEAEGDVATAFTLARIISNIPLARGGPASVVIFDIHALQVPPPPSPSKLQRLGVVIVVGAAHCLCNGGCGGPRARMCRDACMLTFGEGRGGARVGGGKGRGGRERGRAGAGTWSRSTPPQRKP